MPPRDTLMRKLPIITRTTSQACALAVLTACSDVPAPDTGGTSGSHLPRSPALVSSSIVAPSAANAFVLGGVAYISMLPGTDPTARQAEIRNRTGSDVTTTMLEGGFDPVAI